MVRDKNNECRCQRDAKDKRLTKPGLMVFITSSLGLENDTGFWIHIDEWRELQKKYDYNQPE